MGDIRQAFPSKYLRVADLKDSDLTLRINEVAMETIQGKEEPRPVVYFHSDDGHATKPLVLNKTNGFAIAELYGYECDQWGDQSLILFPSTTQFMGETVPCIRVRGHVPEQTAEHAADQSELIARYRQVISLTPPEQESALQQRIFADSSLSPETLGILLRECGQRTASATDDNSGDETTDAGPADDQDDLLEEYRELITGAESIIRTGEIEKDARRNPALTQETLQRLREICLDHVDVIRSKRGKQSNKPLPPIDSDEATAQAVAETKAGGDIPY